MVAPLTGVAHADDAAGPGWSPNYTVFPYNLWQNRVTPAMVTAEGEACHWFNTRYDALAGQVFGFQQALRDGYDVWAGVQGAGDALRADLDQAVANFGRDYVLSVKINPFTFADSSWSLDAQRAGLEGILKKTRGCQVEIIMKDVSTVNHQPERLWQWAAMAREVVAREEYRS